MARPRKVKEAEIVETAEAVEIPESCGECRYWSAEHDHCRRFPSYVSKHRHEWCGEFAR